MDKGISINSKDKSHETQGLMVRWLVQTTILGLIHAASLFVAVRRLDWGWAWAYLAVFLGGQLVAGLILVPRNPELLAERTRLKAEKRDVDRVLAGIMALFGPLAILIVAGLDVRLHWPGHFSPALHVGALTGAALGSLLTVWAMASNRFFYGVLRIETERGHTVATTGPYRLVRHPGYVGAIVFDLVTPLALGSLWALVPAALTVCAIGARTAMEDRTLRQGLQGYAGYARQTRYRLLPGVW
ncbi:MAG: methyltransferase family protein [Chloroflexota bacterium]